ncbi:hypothetical protein AVEN_17402-1 [Araneus ventricosus]|uniref:Uncharacterized protein n=1 Tax=Araneus ventricosus TaxID=182803 RepID=A0A4Y2H338_ARAVE|nr:hypothetical protein AVEN_17402-1 [Araneus ventricosus]
MDLSILLKLVLYKDHHGPGEYQLEAKDHLDLVDRIFSSTAAAGGPDTDLEAKDHLDQWTGGYGPEARTIWT